MLYVDGLPELDDVAFVQSSACSLGGRGAIPAITASCLGSRTALCTVVGGGTPIELMTPIVRAGVATSGICKDSGPCSLFEVIIAIGRKEENCVSYFLPKPIQFVVAETHRALVRSAPFIYFSTHKRSFNLELLKEIRPGQQVVHNISTYLSTDAEYRETMLRTSTVLIGNAKEVAHLLALVDADIPRLLMVYKNLLGLIVTSGSDGSTLWQRGQTELRFPAERVSVKTPVGAGDSFAGGLLHGLQAGQSLVEAMKLGSLTAAESVTGLPPSNCRSFENRIVTVHH